MDRAGRAARLAIRVHCFTSTGASGCPALRKSPRADEMDLIQSACEVARTCTLSRRVSAMRRPISSVRWLWMNAICFARTLASSTSRTSLVVFGSDVGTTVGMVAALSLLLLLSGSIDSALRSIPIDAATVTPSGSPLLSTTSSR